MEPTPQQRGSYTQAKLEAERIVRAAAQERGLPVVILRPGQIWSETSPLITAAVGIRLGQWLVVIGDDSNQLPFVHVDDVVEAIVLSTQSPFSHGEVFQVVDNELMSREELVRLYSRAREPQLRDYPDSAWAGVLLRRRHRVGHYDIGPPRANFPVPPAFGGCAAGVRLLQGARPTSLGTPRSHP